MQHRWSAWAKGGSEDTAWERFRGAEGPARREAVRIARASGAEGAVSVWVQDPKGHIVWCAGEKANELREAGYVIDGDYVPRLLPPSSTSEGSER
jgi:hypothetical protein